MRVEASAGEESASTESVMAKEKSGDLTIPYTNINTLESIATGFRQTMFDLHDGKDHIGEVSCGAGLGTDFIHLEWGKGKKKKVAIVRGLDLLKAWVGIVDPKALERMP